MIVELYPTLNFITCPACLKILKSSETKSRLNLKIESANHFVRSSIPVSLARSRGDWPTSSAPRASSDAFCKRATIIVTAPRTPWPNQ